MVDLVGGPVAGFAVDAHARCAVGGVPPHVAGNIVRQNQRKAPPDVSAIVGIEVDLSAETVAPPSESRGVHPVLRIHRIVDLRLETLVDGTEIDHYIR